MQILDYLINHVPSDWSKTLLSYVQREQILSKWHQPTNVVFSDHTNARDIKKILDIINKHQSDSLTGLTMMVVGMPNVGKSTLLNSLRRVSIGKSKAARTGGQPGITRKMGTSVKIIDSSGDSEGVYLLDTPGVFVPYVPDGETMLKLALCGSVKDSVVDLVTVADYLLYQINKLNPKIYSRYHSPTNDAQEFLARIARKTGRLGPGGEPELDGTAQWVINQWRKGKMGRFVMDDVTVDSLDEDTENVDNRKPSLNQAKKAYKQAHMDKVRTSGSSEQS